MIYDLDSLRGEERIDSRDLIETRDALRAELPEMTDEDEASEARELIAAIDELEAEGPEDWEHGAAFIRDDTFKDYARELAEEIGAIPDDAQWPCTCINWEEAASELAMDFSTTRFLGHGYYVR
jgi:hypothetical protein